MKMKRINLFFSALVIALVAFVALGASLAPAVQMNAMNLTTASNANGKLKGDLLFDKFGRYIINRNTLEEGLYKDFQFFGHDWRLVKVEGNYATFWMSDPYDQTSFSHVESSAVGIYKNGDNIWANGYTDTVWHDTNAHKDIPLGQSDVRDFLKKKADSLLNDKAYASYKNKVVAGYIPQHNEDNSNANHNIQSLAYAKKDTRQVEKVITPTEQLTANWGLNSSDYLWLPSVDDLRVWGVLNGTTLNTNVALWTDTTKGDKVWLRTPSYDDSYRALVLSAISTATTTLDANGLPIEVASSEPTYFYARAVGQNAGVRPAIHLNIQNINAEYEDHVNNPNGKKNWWDDDWLKALFLTVCILGVVGLIMVVIAVVVKVRRARQTHEA